MAASRKPCAACSYLRRKCVEDCVFAEVFPADDSKIFSNVHKVYGASNVGKILKELPPEQRRDAVKSLAYDAEMRLEDLVYGNVGMIFALQQQSNQLDCALLSTKRALTIYMGPDALLPLNPSFDNHGPSAAALGLQHNYNTGPFFPVPFGIAAAGPSNVAGPSHATDPSHDFGPFFPGPSHGASLCLDGSSHAAGPSHGGGGSKLVIREPCHQQQFLDDSFHAAGPSHGGGESKLVIREPHQQQQFLDGPSSHGGGGSKLVIREPSHQQQFLDDSFHAAGPSHGGGESKLVIREPHQQQQFLDGPSSHGGGGSKLVIREPSHQQQFLDDSFHAAGLSHGGVGSKLVIREPHQQQRFLNGPSSDGGGGSKLVIREPCHQQQFLDDPFHAASPSHGGGGSKLVIREPHQQQRFLGPSSHGGGGSKLVIREPNQQQQFLDGPSSHDGGGSTLVIREPNQQQQFLDSRSHAAGPSNGGSEPELVIREAQQQKQFLEAQQQQGLTVKKGQDIIKNWEFNGSSDGSNEGSLVNGGSGFNEVGSTSAAALPSLALGVTQYDLNGYDHHWVQAHHHQQQEQGCTSELSHYDQKLLKILLQQH